MVEPEPLVEQRLELAADPVAVLVPRDEHVGRQGREAARDLPDVQVVEARDAGMAVIASATSSGRKPSGAASSSTRPVRRRSGSAAMSIDAATASDAIGSARSKPVTQMTVPATTVAANAKKSVTRWRKLPSTFRFSRFARATCQIATTLTAAPASAVDDDRRRVDRRAATSSRCTASTTISTPSTSSVIAFACAERISARRKPNVMRPSAGRRARRAAQTESPSAAASISMCAASESSASESARIPTTTSTAMNATISASAIASGRTSASARTRGRERGHAPWP